MKTKIKITTLGRAALIPLAALICVIAPKSIFADAALPLSEPPSKACDLPIGERLEYEFGWNGMPAAVGIFTVREDAVNGNAALRLRTETRTTGKVRMLWKMDDWAESVVHPFTMKPMGYVMHQDEAGDVRDSSVTFDHSKKTAFITRKHKNKVKKKELSFMNAYDPISLSYMIRCVKFKVGDKKVYELVDGHHTYRVILDVVGTESVTTKAGNFAAFKIIPSFVRVPPPTEEEDKILYNATLWMDIEPPHYLLQIKSKIMVGNVYGELVRVSKL